MPDLIQAQIEEAVGAPRHGDPLTHGCPFPRGVLYRSDQVRLTRTDGGELPLQATPLATWPDGSVKWLLLDTQVDLQPRQILPLHLHYGPGVTRAVVDTPLRATPLEEGLQVETGPLQVQLQAAGPALIARANDCLARDLSPQLQLKDEAGHPYTGQVEHLEVEEQNALRLVVRAQGGFVGADGTRPLSWIIRFYFFAHQPFVKLYLTFVHDQDEPVFFRMQEMRFSLPLALQDHPRVMLGAPQTLTPTRAKTSARRPDPSNCGRTTWSSIRSSGCRKAASTAASKATAGSMREMPSAVFSSSCATLPRITPSSTRWTARAWRCTSIQTRPGGPRPRTGAGATPS